MLRTLEDCLGRSRFESLRPIHDEGAVGDFGNDAHVMGDEEDRHLLFPLQFLDQVQDLRLNGHVERRGRLVRNEQLRTARERHGDHDPLEHSARELVRIFAEAALGRRNADPVEQADRLGGRASALDRLRWVIKASWICRPIVSTGLRLVMGSWKIIPISLPRMALHLRFGQRKKITSSSVSVPSRGWIAVAEAGVIDKRRDALAGARFTNDRERFSCVDVES